jgi:hypothetical protein
MIIGAIACAAATLAVASPPVAHHSFAPEFDATREVRATGRVSKVEWMNPHAWFYLDVAEVCERRATPGAGGNDDDGGWTCRTPGPAEVTDWAFELASPNGLMRLGWTRNSLEVDGLVTVERRARARDGSPNGNSRSVTTADGTRLFAGSSEGSTP